MDDINLIYYNYFGTSFFLKRCTINQLNRVQLVFNKSAFDFSTQELHYLSNTIKSSLVALNQTHEFNEYNGVTNTTLSINNEEEIHFTLKELKALNDLVNGTLFNLNFESIICTIIS